ncbi:hypothetical protein DH2020_015435 [Rehmannia glutinosa]|uniref:Stress enhanced protein n=1 Tax=Rehmannia glutinosa TaxID=99300 RepID=A0ABR0WSL8_REHGL
MALGAARPIFCQLRAEKPAVPEFQKLKATETPLDGNGKIVLQPRVCTLRSFGGERGGVIRANRENEVSRFFDTLSDYVESSKKSHDFEIISGRLAMIVFAATVGMEIVTGNSIFRKMDLQGIEEGAGVSLAAITSAAVFAWFSSNRNRVGRIFTVSCNTFIDALIDQIVDGLFYETDISDWSDEI